MHAGAAHQKHVNLPPLRVRAAAPVVSGRPDGHIRHSVAVYIPDAGHGAAQHVPRRQRQGVVARYSDHVPRQSVRSMVHEHDEHGSLIRRRGRVCKRRAHGHVGHAVAVYIPDAGHGAAEIISGHQSRPVGREPRDARYALHAVAVHEHDKHAATAKHAGTAHAHIGDAVAIQVPYAGHGITEPAVVRHRDVRVVAIYGDGAVGGAVLVH